MTAPISEAMQKPACNSEAASPLEVEPFVADARVLNTGLTRDNSLLSEPKISDILISQPFAGDCSEASDGLVAEFIRASVSENTQLAYRSDLKQYEIWGGQIPATPELLATYLASLAGKLSVATLVRRVAAIAKAHEAKGLPSPTTSAIVKATLRGIKRTYGTSQRQSKPLLREDLFLVLDKMKGRPKDVRDRALLILGFGGGFRRSELVGLDYEDIENVREGLIVTLRRSKTDQELAGRKIGITYGRTRHCPVSALDAWVTLSGITVGPLFRPVDRHGHVHNERLSGEAVSIVIRERLTAAGIDPAGYSGHSLRAGFATSAAQAGISTAKIRAQTGHSSDAMLGRYIRDGELFIGNAAGALL